MKYLLLILLIPGLANATISASAAMSEAKDKRAAINKEKDNEFYKLVDTSIETEAWEGNCEADILTNSISDKAIKSETTKLKKLGYTVNMLNPEYRPSFLQIIWCE